MDEHSIIEEDLIIYTDGASKGNPKRGGIGYRYILPNYSQQSESFIDKWEGQFVQGTNNQIELLACIRALEECTRIEGIEKVKTITIFTDSKYVKNHISFAKYRWPKEKWLTSTGEPVENDDLWKKLTRTFTYLSNNYRINVIFEWVKAHQKGDKKDEHNDVADKLAKKGRDCPIKIPFRHVDIRRKVTKESTKKGSVKITGQQFKIRIIGCEHKRTAKTYKLRYEVMSTDSIYHGKVDYIYHEELLMEGHYYEVSTKMDGQVPRILKVIREVDEDLKRNQ